VGRAPEADPSVEAVVL
jgi:hypothetical protein